MNETINLTRMFSEGVLQPFHQLGWWRWMYYVTPYTYLIEAIVGQGTKMTSYSSSNPANKRTNLPSQSWATNQSTVPTRSCSPSNHPPDKPAKGSCLSTSPTAAGT